MLLFFLLILTNCLFCQTEQIRLRNGKIYRVYMSLEDANKVNPDSVFGMELKSKGLNDFPIEILKFKNLKILDLSSYDWLSAPYLLNKRQKRKLVKLQEKSLEPNTPCIKPNTIRNIPEGVKDLNHLEYLDLTDVNFHINIYKKLNVLMPNVYINPPKEIVYDYMRMNKKIHGIRYK